jgi:iron complex transport system permease protein
MVFRLTAAVFLFLTIFVLSLAIGHFPVPPLTAASILFSKCFALTPHWSPKMEIVILQVRLPRILAASLIGAGLSCSGAAYQGMFRNPMVSPDILGVSAGASFGAALSLFLCKSLVVTQLSAFVFGMVAVGITYMIGVLFSKGGVPILIMILSGIIVGTLFNSFISIITLVADVNNTLPAITFWMMGSLATIGINDIVVASVPILFGMAGIVLLRWNLNVMAFGDEEARAMGVRTGLLRLLLVCCATLVTAAGVAIGGVISLVGLIVPHMARFIVGPNYRYLIPASIVMGATFLLVVDDLTRVLFLSEIPIGIVTSILGAPLFLYLLLRSRKGWV